MSMYKLLPILFIALVVRLLFIGNTGFIADISFWKSWSLAAVDHGIVWTAHNTNINYPPGFIYVLWWMGQMYRLVADPHNFNEFWQINNFPFLFISKVPAIVSDLLVGTLIFWFSRKILRKNKIVKAQVPAKKSPPAATTRTSSFTTFFSNTDKLPLILCCLFLFNPVVILDSAVWGQVESYGILFTMITAICFYYKKPALGTFFFTIGLMMKLQNIIYIPLIYVFIFRYFDFKALVRSIASSVAAFVLIILPFLIQQDMARVLLLMTVNNDYFPWLSLHAHNPWWILAKQQMTASDRILTIGVLQAKTFGIIIFSSIYLYILTVTLKKTSYRTFIASLGVAILAFFLFTTQSHERYSYPVIVWLLFLIPFLDSPKWRKFTFIVFGFLTISIFFNMHEGLLSNYPENALQFLTPLTTPFIQNFNVVCMVILFFATMALLVTQISYWYLTIPVIVILLGIFSVNSSYLFKRQISLSSIKPTYSRQGFGNLQKNLAVNSFSGPKSWNFLSSNYFFYTKGLGTHAYSYSTYDLAGKFRRFSTDYGVDSEANTEASVVFKISADDKLLFESPKMGRFDFPRHIEVDVTNLKTLVLEVTDAGDGISNDHADWLNPILYR